jgi:hypothetical protein
VRRRREAVHHATEHVCQVGQRAVEQVALAVGAYHRDVRSRVELGSSLPHDNLPWIDKLTLPHLDPKVLRLTVLGVFGAAPRLFRGPGRVVVVVQRWQRKLLQQWQEWQQRQQRISHSSRHKQFDQSLERARSVDVPAKSAMVQMCQGDTRATHHRRVIVLDESSRIEESFRCSKEPVFAGVSWCCHSEVHIRAVPGVGTVFCRLRSSTARLLANNAITCSSTQNMWVRPTTTLMGVSGCTTGLVATATGCNTFASADSLPVAASAHLYASSTCAIRWPVPLNQACLLKMGAPKSLIVTSRLFRGTSHTAPGSGKRAGPQV